MGSKFLCITCGGNAQRGHFQGDWREGGEPKYVNCSIVEEITWVSKIAQEGKIHSLHNNEAVGGCVLAEVIY